MVRGRTASLSPARPGPVPARFLDLGTLDPHALHAAYQGLALAQGEGACPVLVWARSTAPHLCLGPSQSAGAELDLDACGQAGVAVVRRPLGGGTVLVDGDQRCVFFILPLTHTAARPAHVFGHCLAPLAAAFRAFGIGVQTVGSTDLWAGSAKIAGSGAATLGRSMVFGSSFVLRFPEALFCSLVRAASAGFRDWLREELPAAFTSWARLAPVPPDEALAGALRASVNDVLGWRLEDDQPSADEHRAMRAAEEELRSDPDGEDAAAGRQVTNGIKLNARTFLAESGDAAGWLRVLLRDGRIARIASDDPVAAAALGGCIGRPPREAVLTGPLARVLAPDAARRWAQRIEQCLAGAASDGGAATGPP